MGSRLIGTLVTVMLGSLVLVGCAAEPDPEPVSPVKKGDSQAQTGEQPTTKEPKLEINPNYKGN